MWPGARPNYSDGYRVQWKSGDELFEDAAADGREAIIDGSTNTSYTITGLQAGTEYTVRVIETSPVDDGEPSGEFTTTTVDPAADDVLVGNVSQNVLLTAKVPLSATTDRYIQRFTTGDSATRVESITLPPITDIERKSRFAVKLFSGRRYLTR